MTLEVAGDGGDRTGECRCNDDAAVEAAWLRLVAFFAARAAEAAVWRGMRRGAVESAQIKVVLLRITYSKQDCRDCFSFYFPAVSDCFAIVIVNSHADNPSWIIEFILLLVDRS